MNKNSNYLSFVLLLSFYCFSQHAEKGVFYNQSMGLSWNPLGVLIDSKITGRIPLHPSKNEILWKSTRIELSIQNEWTPADNLLSLSYTIEPIALFNVMFKAGYYAMFDGLGFGCFRMDSNKRSYNASAKKNGITNNADGLWLSINPSIRLQIKKLIIFDNIAINKIHINGERYFLEVRSNLVHAVSDVDIVNDFMAFYKFNDILMSGIRYRYINVLKGKSNSQLLCLASVVQPAAPKFKGFWLFISVGAYLSDPENKGKEYFGILAGKEFVITLRET